MTERVLMKGEFRCPKCGRPRYAIERCCDVYVSEERTYWNGEPAPARKVRVIVGPSPVKTWWCAELEGTEREAVEVNYHGEKFYLDNENGSGWNKVTHGHGSPRWGHSSLPVSRIASADRSPKGEDREDGLHAEHESAVAKPDAQQDQQP